MDFHIRLERFSVNVINILDNPVTRHLSSFSFFEVCLKVVRANLNYLGKFVVFK